MQRILFNVGVTYGRNLICLFLGLFGSRWLLASLGTVDYGLMAVVGALIAIVYFVNAGLSTSSARYFAFSIGAGDVEATNRWFNAALFLHLIAIPLLLLIVLVIGETALRFWLNIPEARFQTALWVFRLSLIPAFIGVAVSPYIDMYIAKQNLLEISIWGILTALVSFSFAFAATQYSGDSWLLYCLGTMAFGVLFLCLQALRAARLYPECRIRIAGWLDLKRLKELLSYSGWGLFGAFGELLRGQGITVLLNQRFTPVRFPEVNASYAIGNTLSVHTQTFANALTNAFAPEITATEGRGERDKMLQHALTVSKFSTVLILLFAVPLLLEMEFVLKFWLQEPPQYAAEMARWILLAFVLDRLTVGHVAAINAHGRIGGYQFTVGGFNMLTLAIAAMFLGLGFGAVSVCWAFVLTVLLNLLARFFWASRLVRLSPIDWLSAVLFPCAFLCAISLSLGGALMQLEPSFIRLLLVLVITLTCQVLIGWWFILDRNGRTSVLNYLKRLVAR